ncbi:MAG: hypothetical protein MMC33_009348 [Icmadophila ericetorum]|nr:hypothetical protein [Icmadophila ericetorum]
MKNLTKNPGAKGFRLVWTRSMTKVLVEHLSRYIKELENPNTPQGDLGRIYAFLAREIQPFYLGSHKIPGNKVDEKVVALQRDNKRLPKAKYKALQQICDKIGTGGEKKVARRSGNDRTTMAYEEMDDDFGDGLDNNVEEEVYGGVPGGTETSEERDSGG